MKKVITRFAPSPTGYLHIGSLRTALFSYLWAKKNNGLFRLRIEDTDQKREVPGSTEHLIHTLDFFCLYHEGDIVIQSKNTEHGLYTKYAQRLIDSKKAYYCFCTEDRLKNLRDTQTAQKLPPRYDGYCRDLDAVTIQKELVSGTAHVIRLRLPEKNMRLTITDGIHGTLHFDTGTLVDAVLLKSDGFPTYHLANIVDDHEMHVTHVIRAEEWLPSLPLHVLLYEYFGFDLPEFYHIPLILNADRTKLSKRQGHVSVESYINAGYLKEALINYIAFLGWNPGDEREIFSLTDLVKEFDLKKVNKAGAIFDRDKLDWYNSWYIKNQLAQKSTRDLAHILKPFLPELDAEQRVHVFSLFFERVHTLSDFAEMSAFLFELPPYDAQLLIFKKSSHEKTTEGLAAALLYFKNYQGEWTHINLELGLKALCQEKDLSFGDVFWPVRTALSGLAASPSPTEIAAFLGRDTVLSRLETAQSKLASIHE